MSSVDDRIVNMQFNNKQFTQGVTQSQRDLTGLDKTLANAGKASGLGKLGDAATQNASKFSAMQVAGVTAIATIANKVTLAAGSMLKKITIQPLIDGFREYQTNLESIQTIMANTGKSVGTVNKYLDQMNEYSDQTIYNFSQMAKNVGTFTAAGVKLPTAVSAIKGISNLAALSGSNSQQASTAMYQLSQAISAGKVGLQDWNSVVNAGMGGKVFKERLAQTAVAMGDISSSAVKVGTDVEIAGQSFRNSIMATPGSESWLTSDVLVATLAQLDGRFSKTAIKAELLADGFKESEVAGMAEAKMAKARIELAKQGIKYSDEEYDAMVKKADAAYAAATQIKTASQLFQVVQESIGSMWASAFRIILGDFAQSKELWGNVGDVVLGIVDNISGGFLGMLRVWEERGGRMKVIDGLANVFGGLVDVFGAIAKGFDAAFPDSNVSLLNRMSKAFFAFSEALVPSEDTLKDIGTIAEAVFSVLHFGFTVFKGVVKGLSAFFGALFGATDGARGGILSLVASVAEVVIAFEGWLTSGGKISGFLKGIGQVAGGALAPIVSLIGSVIAAFGALASGNTGKLIGVIHDIRNTFFGFIESVLNGLAAITAPIGAVSDFFSGLANSVGGLKTTLSDFYRDMNSQGGSAPTPLVAGLQKIKDIVGSIGDAFDAGFSGIGDLFNDLGGAASSAASSIGGGMTTGFSQAADAADSVAESTKGIYDEVSGAGAAAATSSLSAVSAGAEKTGSVFETVGGILRAIGRGIGDAFRWMVDAISNIPFPDDALEWASVLNGLIGAALIKKLFFSKGIFDQFKETIAQFGDAWENTMNSVTDTLKTMQGAVKSQMIKNIAIAVALLVGSLIALSFVPQDKLKNGLAALATVMGLTAGMMQLMMMSLKKIDVKDLIKFGVGFALVGVGMMAMATAVLILTGAVVALGMVPIDKLKQGLTSVAILMGIMVASLLLLSGQSAKVAAVGGAMFLMATAIDIMVLAVMALGALPMDKVEQGLTAVGIGIGIMTGALLLLSGSSAKVLAAGGAMVMMATALNILIPLIVTMGLLPWDVVKQGLTAVGIGLLMMVVALDILAAGGPQVMAAGLAMIMIATALNILIPLIVTLGSLPWDVVQAGLIAMAIALGILVIAAALAMPVQAGLYALSVVILAMGVAMLLAGTGMALFAGGLALLVAVGVAAIGIIVLAIHAFIALLPMIAIQVAAAFVTFLQAIALASPKIRKALGEIIKNMIGTVRDAIPELEKLFKELIEAGLNVIESYVDDFTQTGINILLNFLVGLEQKLPRIIEAATRIAEAFISGMADNAVRIANAGADALIDILEGFEDAVRTKGPRIREAMRGLADAMRDEFFALTRDIFDDIPMPDFPDWVKNPLSVLPGVNGRVLARGAAAPKLTSYQAMLQEINEMLTTAMKNGGKSMATQLIEAGGTVATALERALSLMTGSDGTTRAAQFGREADQAQSEALYAGKKGEFLDTAATKAEEKAEKQREKAKKIKDKKKRDREMKEIKEGAGKKAKALRDQATKAATQAEKAQARADERAQQAQEEMAYQASLAQKDFAGAGDVRSQQGQDVADKAQAMLAQSQAKMAEADRLAKGNAADKKKAKQLREEARKDAAEANRLALQAIEIQGEAQKLYAEARRVAAEEVRARMGDIRAQIAEEKAEREWQKKFDDLEEDPEAQAKMLEDRAKVNEDKAEAARIAMEAAFTEAERLADTDAVAANAALDEAERQAQLSQAAADAAAADLDQAEALRKKKEEEDKAAASGTTTSGAQINPSRTAMEDAASAVDRYTASMQQAEEMAGAGSTTTQFVQNNYSPEALSASQLYRQGKNLVSAAELKMAGT